MASSVMAERNILSCKKCGGDHEKPVGSKCDRPKVVKDDKRDSSKETPVKRTPKGKGTGETSTQDKMLETMLSTMNSFSEKLMAMEQRISGFATPGEISRSGTSITRKSRSREKIRRIEISDDDDKPPFTSPEREVVQAKDGMTFAKVFADTAVAVRPAATPARHKKQVKDSELGVASLFKEPPQLQTKHVTKNPFPRVTATVSKPTDSNPTWEAVAVMNLPGAVAQTKTDFNHNVLSFTDQYGNPVQVQAPVQAEMASQITYADAGTANNPLVVQQQSIESLRNNPIIQQLVEERVALLETRMKTELSQGNVLRKKSGRYNTADTPCGPTHMRWPNESCLVGTNRKRPAYDDLTMGQFVIGFLNNVRDTQDPQVARCMLTELNETIKLAENLSWPIARGAFATSMHKLEDGTLTWDCTRQLADNRLTFSQSAVFSGSVTMSPRPGTPTQNSGTLKRIACKWYNEGSCPHSADHLDASGGTLFRHICMYCFRTLKRNNGHTELECMNKKKPSD